VTHACQPDAAALHDAAAVGAVLAAVAVSATIVALAATVTAAAVGATIVAPAASVAAQCASGWIAYSLAADLHAPFACSFSHA
jgi:hypothetical protein